MNVKKDVVVTLTYIMRLADGDLVEEVPADEPLVYLHGYGNIILGLEDGVEGMSKGESRSLTIAPADAFGEYDEENIMTIPREALPGDISYKEGLELAVVDEDDEESIATVLEVGPEAITMDFNHPLAGETLIFEVTVLDVRAAEAEEIAHGHAHHNGHHHD